MAAILPHIAEGTIVGYNAGSKRDIRQLKQLYVETADTVDAADTIPLTLSRHGITTMQAFMGFKHTTNNSVVVTENPTSAVSGGIVTFTCPAGTDNDKRIIVIHYT